VGTSETVGCAVAAAVAGPVEELAAGVGDGIEGEAGVGVGLPAATVVGAAVGLTWSPGVRKKSR